MKQFDITYFHGPFSEYITDEVIRVDIDDNGVAKVLEFNLKTGEVYRDN